LRISECDEVGEVIRVPDFFAVKGSYEVPSLIPAIAAGPPSTVRIAQFRETKKGVEKECEFCAASHQIKKAAKRPPLYSLWWVFDINGRRL
jgi:hypothetical protein